MNFAPNMKVIVVQGVPHSGKTTVLQSVCAQTLKKPGVTTICQEFVTQKSKADQYLIINDNGQIKAICTPGDDANFVARSFAYAEHYKCSVLALAVSYPKNKRQNGAIQFNEGIKVYAEIVQNHQLNPIIYHTTKYPKKQLANRASSSSAIAAQVLTQI